MRNNSGRHQARCLKVVNVNGMAGYLVRSAHEDTLTKRCSREAALRKFQNRNARLARLAAERWAVKRIVQVAGKTR
jgi:phosphopantetheinyl transferase (holo-ACP synthase)